MLPQVFSGEFYDAQPADLWSCAIVLVAMLAGCMPNSTCSDTVAFSLYVRTGECGLEGGACGHRTVLQGSHS
jgi:hypothetical protein